MNNNILSNSTLTSESDNSDNSYKKLIFDYEKLRHYNLIYEIAIGGASRVWLSYNTNIKKFNIIKIYNNNFNKDALKEIKFCTLLKRKPNNFNIVLEYFNEIINEKKFICSSWDIYYSDLYKIISKENNKQGFSLKLSLNLMNQLLTAVKFLHIDIKTIHGDIKTDNLLVKGLSLKNKYICDKYIEHYNKTDDHEESVKYCMNDIKSKTFDNVLFDDIKIVLSDFDTINRSHTYKNHSFGTIYYNSPEQMLKGYCSYPIDIWACGCVFYELLTGHILFKVDDTEDAYLNKYNQLSLMHDYCGSFSSMFLKTTKEYKKFFNNYKLINYSNKKENTMNKTLEKLFPNNYINIIELLTNFLKINPRHRQIIKDINLTLSYPHPPSEGPLFGSM